MGPYYNVRRYQRRCKESVDLLIHIPFPVGKALKFIRSKPRCAQIQPPEYLPLQPGVAVYLESSGNFRTVITFTRSRIRLMVRYHRERESIQTLRHVFVMAS